MRIMLPLAATQNNATLKRNFAENFRQWCTIQPIAGSHPIYGTKVGSNF